MHNFRWVSIYLLELRILLSEFREFNLSRPLRRWLWLCCDLLPDIFRLFILLFRQLLIVWIPFHHAFNDILAVCASKCQLIAEVDPWNCLFSQLQGDKRPSFARRRHQAMRKGQLIHLNVKLLLSRREDDAVLCIV